MLITCNDLHLTDVPPASRVDNYVDELFGLLDQVATLAVKVRADAVCIAGDIFHHKERPMGMPLLYRFYEWCDGLRRNHIPVLAIPGNHDLRYNRLDTLEAGPLGLLFRVGALHNVAVLPVALGDHVSVSGVPYPTAMTIEGWARSRPQPRLPFTDLPTRHVVLGHCFASATGGQFFGDAVLRYDDIIAAHPADVYVFGHDHSNGGIHTRGDRRLVNLGALSRGSIGFDDITRDITVGLVTIPQTGAIAAKQVRLKAQPSSELFDLAAKAAKDEERDRLEAYVATLQDTLASLDATTPIAVHLGKLCVDEEVRTRMQQYITDAEQL